MSALSGDLPRMFELKPCDPATYRQQTRRSTLIVAVLFLALAAFGSHWVIVGAAAVLVLRALQLPLVTTLVAERNPGTLRVSALASNAVWRDIGAGLGPLLAGLLLPVASAPWVFGLAGAAIAVSAVFCWRARLPTDVSLGR